MGLVGESGCVQGIMGLNYKILDEIHGFSVHIKQENLKSVRINSVAHLDYISS